MFLSSPRDFAGASTQHIADQDDLETEVIIVAQPAPVFVDSTGRRRRLLRRFAYGFTAFCMMHGRLISLSLAGGPVSPSAVLPLPGLVDGGEPAIGGSLPRPEPVVTAPKSVLVNEATSPRQLMYLVLIQSAMTAMTGGRLRWHKLHRAGLHGTARLKNGVKPVTDEKAPAETYAALTETTAEQPLVRVATGEAPPVVRQVTAGRAKVPGQGVAPVLDSWPSVLPSPSARHPAAGRATARPPLAGGVPGQVTAAHHRPGARGPVPAGPADAAGDDNAALEPSTSDDPAQDGAAPDLHPLDETALRRH